MTGVFSLSTIRQVYCTDLMNCIYGLFSQLASEHGLIPHVTNSPCFKEVHQLQWWANDNVHFLCYSIV